jgi:hypothetical protein
MTEAKKFSLFNTNQTKTEANREPHPMDSEGFLPGVKRQGVKLTTDHLVPRLIMYGTIPPLRHTPS